MNGMGCAALEALGVPRNGFLPGVFAGAGSDRSIYDDTAGRPGASDMQGLGFIGYDVGNAQGNVGNVAWLQTRVGILRRDLNTARGQLNQAQAEIAALRAKLASAGIVS